MRILAIYMQSMFEILFVTFVNYKFFIIYLSHFDYQIIDHIKFNSQIRQILLMSTSTLRKYLTEYLLQCNKLESLAESIRQSLAKNPYFQIVSAFERFDKFRKGYLEPADFSEFMLQNKVYPTQRELYLIFKDFDINKKGMVTLKEFQIQLLPRQNRKLRKTILQRKPYPTQLRLQIDLEFLLGKYFQDKINTIQILNNLRDKMKLLRGSYAIDCFVEIDSRRASFLSSPQEIDNFLRTNGKVLKNEELQRIFRALNFNLPIQLRAATFREHLDPFGLGCYEGYRIKMHQKQSMQHHFIAKKYEVDRLRAQNIIDNGRLHYEIEELRESNRRLQHIMSEQDVLQEYETRRWYGY